MVALNQTRNPPTSVADTALKPRKTPPDNTSFPTNRMRSLLRARYYDPLTAEFTSPDPLEYVDGMSLYRAYFVPGAMDPTGKLTFLTDGLTRWEDEILPRWEKESLPIIPTKKCKIELVCTKLIGPVEHCGVEVTDAQGKRYFHVVSPTAGLLGDTCDVKDTGAGRINTPIGVAPWVVKQTWHDPTGATCGCIERIAGLIRSKFLRYEAIPSNTTMVNIDRVCKSHSTCNSNYTTKCILRKCGLAPNFGGLAPGWNHRMKKCTDFKETYIMGELCDCKCKKWETIDDSWCAD